LAILILWWAFGADPFGAGPTVGRFAPWIVPGKLRRVAQPARRSGEEAPRSEVEPPSEKARPGGVDGEQELATEGRRIESPPENAPQDPASSHASGDDRGADQDIDKTDGAAADGEPGESGAANRPRAESAVAGHPIGGEQRAAGSAGVVGVRNAPRPDADDLAKALQRALGFRDAWKASSGKPSEQRRKLAADFYDSLARLGEVVTFVNPRDEETRSHIQRMHQMLLDTIRLPRTSELIRANAARWLEQHGRDHRGVVLIGEVRRVRTSGPFYETRLELWGKERRVLSVVSRVNPVDFFKPNTRVLMLGAVVEQPTTRLAGYQGDEPMVIMGGYPLVLPGERSS
jgi:hypothetical protein